MDNTGDRIKSLRGFLAMSRREFCHKHGIPEVTLKSWELSLKAISLKQVEKIISAFEKEGVSCSQEWLLNGTPPSPFSQMEDIETPFSLSPHRFLLTSGFEHLKTCSLKIFYGIYPQGTHFIVPDNKMSPFFLNGETVCAIPVTSVVSGVPYLIEDQDNKRFVRLVFRDETCGSFKFQTINPDQSSESGLLGGKGQNFVAKQIYHIIMTSKIEPDNPLFSQQGTFHETSPYSQGV